MYQLVYSRLIPQDGGKQRRGMSCIPSRWRSTRRRRTMGPYCNFCQTRCFTPFPKDTPAEVFAAYRPGVSIIATCGSGQEWERQQTGWNYRLIWEAIEDQQHGNDIDSGSGGTAGDNGQLPAPAYSRGTDQSKASGQGVGDSGVRACRVCAW